MAMLAILSLLDLGPMAWGSPAGIPGSPTAVGHLQTSQSRLTCCGHRCPGQTARVGSRSIVPPPKKNQSSEGPAPARSATGRLQTFAGARAPREIYRCLYEAAARDPQITFLSSSACPSAPKQPFGTFPRPSPAL